MYTFSSTEFRRKLGITDCSILQLSSFGRISGFIFIKATEERTEESSVHDF